METRTTRPQLTISLLASDRPDTIRRCLDSLRPIMEAVPSELILVDTSKNPVVHEILLEYTDQVYEFEWCKDFSKARNVGLKKAKGEWFLFLDDDEWFVEIDELINFFQSGEYRSYGYANYQVRNFYDPSYTYYSDSWVSRMIRIDEDTHFRSKIHEYMYPVRGKCKHIYSIAYHSGYIYATEEQKRAHFERNSSLLLEMIEEEPDNLRWQIQLAQEYRSVKEWETLCEYCKGRLEATKHINEKYDNVHLGTFYAGYSEGLVFLKEYDKALAVCEEAIDDKRSTELCKALMHQRMAEIYLKIGNYEESTRLIRQYLQELDTLGKNENLLTIQKMALLVNEAFDETSVKKAYSILISCGLKQGSTRFLNQYYDELGWNSSVIYVFDGTEEYIVEAMATMECEPVFVQMVSDAYKNNEFRRLMCKAADEWEERDAEGFKKIMSVYAQADVEDWYIWYARCQMKNTEIWGNISVEEWKRIVQTCIAEAAQEKIEQIKTYMNEVLDISDWRCRYFNLIMLEWQVVNGIGEDCDVAKYREVLLSYAEATLAFYSNYYRQECFINYPEVLPPNVQAALKIAEFAKMESQDRKTALSKLKECVERYPVFAEGVREFLQNYLELEHESVENQNTEMIMLRNQIMVQVKDLIMKDRLADAATIVAQLRQMMPQDEEVIALNKELKEAMQEE